MLIKVNTRSTKESPLPRFQLKLYVNSCSMILPISKVFDPPRIFEITNEVMEGTNTIVIPLMTPGIVSVKMIFRQIVK